MEQIGEQRHALGIKAACGALGVAPASYYRWRRPRTERKEVSRHPRALSAEERQGVLAVLHEERFCDQAPAEVYATLLDEEKYLCSERTMYRILAAHEEVRERRNQLRHPRYAAPELLATRPNEVWSWDITKLLGPSKWTYYYLYVILDIFSRYVVGWMLAYRESALLAQRLIEHSVKRQGIEPGQLTVHADRGTAMTSKAVAWLLAELGVTKTHSRPHVSNDNPYSESQFKTLKYRPEFPDRFGCFEDGRSFCSEFFHWYNHEHHHSGLGYLTPHAVHHGLAARHRQERVRVLCRAFEKNPERFVRGVPKPPALPEQAWINKPKEAVSEDDQGGSTAQSAPVEGIATKNGFHICPISNDLELGTVRVREKIS
jgi:putative transposase